MLLSGYRTDMQLWDVIKEFTKYSWEAILSASSHPARDACLSHQNYPPCPLEPNEVTLLSLWACQTDRDLEVPCIEVADHVDLILEKSKKQVLGVMHSPGDLVGGTFWDEDERYHVNVFHTAVYDESC
ncbi:hypothetical protein MKZ38_001674 [Zalerion maritima]|uniref:Uncharacterized protein n=1 Tax=Zalerion maritima TaxID=339359 RepID=A0AAD5RR40_9PEZI|nr:hypothetical protein MKZ38_001674 [Zalerion maritima]